MQTVKTRGFHAQETLVSCVNNFQRMVENLPIQEAGMAEKIKSLASELEKNGDEKIITEMLVMLSRVASKNKVELEVALYKRMDEMRKR